ncbi:MAG: glucose-6-phosphate isomerase [Caulobacterales bacterium]|nr:glucose-6-phosphate isomerase [Caulobacterales bacterium]
MSLDAARDRLTRFAERDATGSILQRFLDEPARLDRLTLEAAGLYLDLSKQSWSLEGLDAALDLARAAGVEAERDRMAAGHAINASEGRAVLHMALRAQDGADFRALGKSVSADVTSVRTAMRRLVDDLRNGRRTASDGGVITTVVHIGIGGSDLGPRMIWTALRPLQPVIDLRFVANIDGSDLAEALDGLDPSRTLVIVVSKTFTTLETLANAEQARTWLRKAVGEAGLAAHLVGVSAAPERARAFGCGEVLGFADWVGGRFSLWSAVGTSLAIGLGWQTFERLLAGARAMDDHFRQAPLDRNAPVLLAAAEAFNVAAGRSARTVVPYAHRLRLLPAFLQQLEMESNGKCVGKDGWKVAGPTCPAIFGEPGTNAQHAYFQLLHQGTAVVPVDFIVVARNAEGEITQIALNANALAQAEALMVGRSESQVRADLSASGISEAEADVLAPQKTFPGNRPSSMIVLESLTPESLGALIALYEHKTFVEGVLWGLNSFDQWGVELGKVLARTIDAEMNGGGSGSHDPSTAALINRLKAR